MSEKVMTSESELYNQIVEMLSNGNFLQLNGKAINLTELNEYINAQQEENERLNKKIEQYEDPEDMTLMFMWCDEKAKDEIKRLNNIINEINSIVEYWGYDKEHNDISSFRMAMKSIKDILGSDKE